PPWTAHELVALAHWAVATCSAASAATATAGSAAATGVAGSGAGTATGAARATALPAWRRAVSQARATSPAFGGRGLGLVGAQRDHSLQRPQVSHNLGGERRASGPLGLGAEVVGELVEQRHNSPFSGCLDRGLGDGGVVATLGPEPVNDGSHATSRSWVAG